MKEEKFLQKSKEMQATVYRHAYCNCCGTEFVPNDEYIVCPQCGSEYSVEVSLTFGANGNGADGYASLTKEQEEIASYVFKDVTAEE